MFNSAFGIFSCQNAYDCIEQFILSVLSIATLYFYVRGYKIITNDRAQILEKMDKVIFYLAFIFTAILTFNHLVYTAPFLAYTMRVIYLIMDVVICSVVACIFFEQDHHSKIEKVMQGTFGWIIMLWFFSIMGRQSDDEEENECHHFGIVLFACTGLLISLVLAFCGYGSIKKIRETETDENTHTTDAGDTLSQVRKYQESNERVEQLAILVLVNIIAALAQFVWDLKKYDQDYTDYQCNRIVAPHGFFSFIRLTLMEAMCTLLPPWGIYYLYYWRNRTQFRGDAGTWDRHLSDFDEIRSDLIEMS